MIVVYTVMIIQCLEIASMFCIEGWNLYGGFGIGAKCALVRILGLVVPSSFFREDTTIKASALFFFIVWLVDQVNISLLEFYLSNAA